MTLRPALVGIAIAAGLVAAVWVATAHRISLESETAIEAAKKANANLAIAYEESTIAALSEVDQLLRLAAIEYLHEGAKAQATLAEWPVNPDLVLGLALFDRDGRRVISTGREDWPHSLPPESLAKDTGDALHVSRAEWDEAHGHWHITVSRPIRGPRGAFEGLATARANLAHFTDFYRRADLGHNGVVTLVGRDGFARVRQTGAVSTFNVDMRDTLLMTYLGERTGASFESRGKIDGTPRIFSYRALKDRPLVIMVGTDKRGALASAVERAGIYYKVAGASSMLILLGAAWITATISRQRRDLQALDRAQRVLLHREAHFRGVFESASEGIILFDENLRVVDSNPAAERIFGGTPAALIERRDLPAPLALVNEDGSPLATEQRPASRALRTGRPVTGQIVGMSRPGEPTQWLSVSAATMRIPGDREHVGVVSTLIDVTEERAVDAIMARLLQEARENAARLQATFDQALVGIGHAALDGKLLRVNGRLCEMLGYSQAELLATDLLHLVHPDDVAATRAEIRQMTVSLEAADPPKPRRYLRKDGGIVWALTAVSLARKPDGSPDYFLGMIQDVTEIKRAERLRDEFISTVSHELRTPLTSIGGSLGLLAGGVTGPLPPEASTLIDIAAKNCRRLTSLVNDLLDVERMASGKLALQLRVTALGPVLRAVVRDNEGFARQHGVVLQLDTPPDALPANVDGERLAQAVANLVSNAAKFSPRGGVVEVVLRRRGERARIEVRDRGPGIPLEFRDQIFKRFSQADGSATRRMGGSGLGLSITRGLVERMGGTIGYDTIPGEGTTFFIEIPLVDAGASRAAAGAPHNLEA